MTPSAGRVDAGRTDTGGFRITMTIPTRSHARMTPNFPHGAVEFELAPLTERMLRHFSLRPEGHPDGAHTLAGLVRWLADDDVTGDDVEVSLERLHSLGLVRVAGAGLEGPLYRVTPDGRNWRRATMLTGPEHYSLSAHEERVLHAIAIKPADVPAHAKYLVATGGGSIAEVEQSAGRLCKLGFLERRGHSQVNPPYHWTVTDVGRRVDEHRSRLRDIATRADLDPGFEVTAREHLPIPCQRVLGALIDALEDGSISLADLVSETGLDAATVRVALGRLHSHGLMAADPAATASYAPSAKGIELPPRQPLTARHDIDPDDEVIDDDEDEPTPKSADELEFERIDTLAQIGGLAGKISDVAFLIREREGVKTDPAANRLRAAIEDVQEAFWTYADNANLSVRVDDLQLVRPIPF